MDSQYEIHLVRAGHKEVLRVSRRYMSSSQAWGIALMHAGACYGEITQLAVHESIMLLAKQFSVSGVRWNKASHTISFTERTSLTSLKLCTPR
ncbi:hypothetical protein SAMN02745962_03459 [Pseudomonas sp. LAIL14HWK12:I11]|jgi:hypothetical protein|nr:hypothetical protein SAMN02745962_03459 [Pseudomonas sp. LAIL14HWK12:I11]SMR78837.1 hypothetical protein SAMN05661028_03642 [Pseudomonas sp. LAIL14HWK12:I10]SOD04595.1 hypothetical protein SAMN05660296_03191 [Pseudomonas sp. LAIL14HWK12:I8]